MSEGKRRAAEKRGGTNKYSNTCNGNTRSGKRNRKLFKVFNGRKCPKCDEKAIQTSKKLYKLHVA